MLITDEFRTYFEDEDLADIDQENATVYGLTADLKIALVNEAWMRFARENKAPREFFEKYTLGANYVECLPEPMRGFFDRHIRNSMVTQEPWTFDYLCHSPAKYRKYHMQVLPLAAGKGCLVSNALMVEMPHLDDAWEHENSDASLHDDYVGDGDLITQCSHCRRTRHVGDSTRWDWIPQFLEDTPVSVSHSICPTCFSYFYPSVDPD